MSERIEVEVQDHVALLSFSNPPVNFATVSLMRGIADALDAIDADPALRVTVLFARGKTFCAGANLVAPNGFGAQSDDPLREFYDEVERVFCVRKPFIAAVQGAAVGAGLGLAVSADLRVAAPEARFAANFTKIGLHPGFGLSVTLPRLIGASRAAQMFLTAARYKPEEVIDWGLVDRIVPAGSLRDAALAFAGEIAANAPLAVMSTRASLRAALADEVRRALLHEHTEQRRLQRTADYAEGLRAVEERRPGRFEGR